MEAFCYVEITGWLLLSYPRHQPQSLLTTGEFVVEKKLKERENEQK